MPELAAACCAGVDTATVSPGVALRPASEAESSPPLPVTWATPPCAKPNASAISFPPQAPNPAAALSRLLPPPEPPDAPVSALSADLSKFAPAVQIALKAV